MEEQKNNSKEIKMQSTDKQPEFTKEQLKDMADKLFNENRWLRQQNQQMNQALMGFDRLDYLLRVISIANDCKNYGFDSDFIQKCIDEVQKAIPTSGNPVTLAKASVNGGSFAKSYSGVATNISGNMSVFLEEINSSCGGTAPKLKYKKGFNNKTPNDWVVGVNSSGKPVVWLEGTGTSWMLQPDICKEYK